jgi:selenide, water dikinase
MSYLEPWASIDGGVAEDVAVLLQDAQTSGGLLLATADAPRLAAELSSRDVPAAVIGAVRAGDAGHIEVLPGS